MARATCCLATRSSTSNRAEAGPNYATCFPELRLIATQLFAEIKGAKRTVSSLEMRMPKRSAKSVTAVFASFLAGVALTAISTSAARAADDCLASPKHPAPQGSQWYYRLDRATQRQCWYLRDKRTGIPQFGRQISLSPAMLISPKALTASQVLIANARDELPASMPEQVPSRNDEPAPAMASETGAREDNSSPAMPAAETPRSILMIALALAGIIASVIFKLGGQRRPRRAKLRKRRGAIWASVDRDRRTPLTYSGPEDLQRRRDFARDLDRTVDPRARSKANVPRFTRRSPT